MKTKIYEWLLRKLKFNIEVDSLTEMNAHSEYFGEPYLRVRVLFGEKLFNTWFIYNKRSIGKLGEIVNDIRIKPWKKLSKLKQ